MHSSHWHFRELEIKIEKLNLIGSNSFSSKVYLTEVIFSKVSDFESPRNGESPKINDGYKYVYGKLSSWK